MTCEEVRPMLPDLAEGIPRAAGAAEVHLATCRVCAEELAQHRAVLLELRALRDDVSEPPDDFLVRLLAGLPELARRGRVRRIAGNEHVQHAALSLGGAVVGATAIGLLWWRNRRALTPASQVGAGGR